MDKTVLTTLLPLAVIAVVMFFRFRALKKERPLNLKRIWILPGIVLVLGVMTVAAAPPDRPIVLWSILAFAIGGGLGWYRGKTTAIHYDRDSGTLTQKPSIAGLLLIGAIIAAKLGARTILGIDPAAGTADHAALMFTDALLAFALGFLAFTQVELTLRARRLIAGR